MEENRNIILDGISKRLQYTFEQRGTSKAAFTDTTNKKFSHYIGFVKPLSIGICAYFGDLRTSYIQKVHKEDKFITIYTRNSTYKFEDISDGSLLSDKPNGILFELSQAEIDEVERFLNG